MMAPGIRTLAALSAASLLAWAPVRAQAGDNLAPRPAAGATALTRRIDAVLARPALAGADWGIEVRDAATGQVLYQRNAARPFIPASNLKLIVSATAAHHLEADYRFRTTVYATGPVRDGVLEGDLVLYGRGDPLLSGRFGRPMAWAWNALADSLAARGIRRVSGGVVADDSYFEARHVRPDWEEYDLRWWYAAPVSALGFNDNSIEFRVTPGAVGAKARVTWLPQSEYVQVENRTVTVARGRRQTVEFERIPGNPRGIRVFGQMPANGGDTQFFAVSNGAAFAGTAFREALERRGIEVARDEVRVVADSLRSPARGAIVLAEHASDPLPRVIGPILLNSQNWFAETLAKTVGRVVRGEGSWDAGLAVEREFLTGVVGIDPNDIALSDASGLSANNRVTPRALVRLLGYVRRTPRMAIVRDALPVSGGEGSLRARFTDLRGRVAAKTGYIGGVDSLSGWVTTDDGRTVIFAVIANRTPLPSPRMKVAIDDVVRAIATTPAD
jgi:D-alanyl-D-alanine carboxypeptidase/D-alanyl-D-alanine-endopeptidase (penicillin-binding protein 4)